MSKDKSNKKKKPTPEVDPDFDKMIKAVMKVPPLPKKKT